MTRNLLLSVMLLSGFAFGQGVRYDNFTWTANPLTPGQTANVTTIPRATIHVCYYPANATPCTNYAPIYSDNSLSTPIAQPGFASDDYGNFGFWSTAGTYQYTVTYNGISSGPYSISVGLANSTLGSQSSPASNPNGTPNLSLTAYDGTATYNSNAKFPFGLPANVGTLLRAVAYAPNTNLDRLFAVSSMAECGTPDAPLSTLPSDNAKLGGYFYGGATSDGVCAPMGLNAVVAGYPANNSSIFGTEIDWNGNGTDVAANLATAPNYSGIKIASGGAKKGGAFLSTSATSFPTNGMQYGMVLAHWLSDGYVCEYTVGATGTTCYYAAPAGNASTNLGSQVASTSLAMQDHRWNGASDSADIYTMLLNPNSSGTDSCWELRNGSGTAITKSCGLFNGLAAQFGESTSIAAHFLKNTVTEGCTNGVPCNRITPVVSDSGVALAISDSGNTSNRAAVNFDGSASFGSGNASISTAGKVTANGGIQAGASGTTISDSRSLVQYFATLTTTAAASDNVSISGVTASSHCFLQATNASAATNIATTYVSAKTTNQITVSHTATASMTYDIGCSAN